MRGIPFLFLCLFLMPQCSSEKQQDRGVSKEQLKLAIQTLVQGEWPVVGRLKAIEDQKPTRGEPLRGGNSEVINLTVLLDELLAEGYDQDLLEYRALVEISTGNLEIAESLLADLSSDHSSPSALNTLAVLYATMAASGAPSCYSYFALETINTGVELYPNDPVLLYNQALFAQNLFLSTKAKAAWEKFLRIEDQDSPWCLQAEEYLDKLKAVAKPLGKNETEQDNGDALTLEERAQKYTWHTYIACWDKVEDFLNNHSEVRLAEIKSMAEALKPFDGECFSAYSTLASVNDEEMSLLKKTMGHLKMASDSWDINDEENEGTFQHIRKARRAAGNFEPFASRSAFLELRYRHANKQYDVLQNTDLDVVLEKKGFLISSGRLKGTIALGAFIGSNWEKNYSYLREANELYKKSGVEHLIAHSAAGIGNVLASFGAYESALDWKTPQLEKNHLDPEPRRHYLVYNDIADDLNAMGLVKAAGDFYTEAYQKAVTSGDQISIIQTSRELAQLLIDHDRHEEAKPFLHEAFKNAENLPENSDAYESLSKLYLTQGEFLLPHNPTAAVDALAKAESFFRKRKYLYWLPRLKQFESDAHFAIGNLTSAENAINQGIAMIESMKPDELEKLKTDYMDYWATRIYDRAIQIQLDLGEKEKALELSERSRALTLNDQLKQTDSPLQIIEGFQLSLNNDQAVVYYHQLKDSLQVWVLGKTLEHKSLPALSQELIDSLSKDDSLYQNKTLASLHDAIISPIKPWLEGKTQITFMPHRGLWAIPYAALLDKNKNQYLLMQHVISLAPSLRVLSALRPISQQRDNLNGLIMGNPDHDPALFRGVKLKYADKEAEEVANRFGITHYQDAEVTEERFIEEGKVAHFIHFAGHGVSIPKRPDQSCLWVSPNQKTGSLGRLTAEKIQGNRFPKTNLVVLSACQAGAPQDSISEGGGNLARPFLANGVPVVVASLTNIRDNQNIISFIDVFYEQWQMGQSPAKALNQAQKDAIRQGLSLKAWSNWQIYGRCW